MMESSGQRLDPQAENAIFRPIRRFAADAWKDVLTGILAGLEIAYLWWYFLGPFASSVWQTAALLMPEQIYQGTPRLWLPFVIVALSLLFLIRELQGFLVRLWKTWQAENFQGNVVIWAVLSIGGTLSLFSGNRLAFGVCCFLAIGLTAVQFVLVRRKVAKEQAAIPGASFVEPDDPITALKEDLLNRAPIVQTLKRLALVDRLHVVALEGAFGDGKTSVLRLLEEALTSNHLDSEEIVVVWFSPWLAGNKENLAASLMNAIVRAIQKQFYVPPLRREFLKYVRILAGITPYVGSSLKEVFRERTQDEQLEELKKRIQALPVRVVVLVDDMDRLMEDELKPALKLIRGTADFRNVTFVCAFHMGALAKQMSRRSFSEADAIEYLEKFFPTQLHLPKISSEFLEEGFLEKLRRLAGAQRWFEAKEGETEMEQSLNTGRVLEIALQLLSNLRRQKLFFNSVSSAMETIAREVNPTDFIVLELIRLTSPDVYDQIYANRKMLYNREWSGDLADFMAGDADKINRQRKDRVSGMTGGLPADREQQITVLLRELFPLVADALEGHVVMGAVRDESSARQQRRICHPDYFPRYFIFGVPASHISEVDIAKFLDDLKQSTSVEAAAKRFETEFSKFEKASLKRWRFLDMLVRKVGAMPETAAEGLAYGVARVSDDLGIGLVTLGEDARARALVYVVAEEKSPSPEVQVFLEKIIAIAPSDEFAAGIFFYIINRDRNRIITNWTNIDGDKLKRCYRARMHSKYMSAGKGLAFDLEKPERLSALFRWVDTGPEGQTDVKNLLSAEFARSPHLIGKVISRFFGNEEFLDSETPKSLARLYPLDELRLLISKYNDKAWSTVFEQKAIERFLKHAGGADLSADGSAKVPMLSP